MASMTQATATGITAMRHSSRKEKRELLKGMQRDTTDPNDLIASDEEEGHQGTDSKQGHKDTYQNPPSLPSNIKVMKASNSHVTSSVTGLSSIVDMSMTEICEENQVLMVKGCMKNHVFSIWKFYQKDFHSHFSKDDNTMCGVIMKHTNIGGTQNWWLGMRRIVVKTNTDL
jgi:hypothetical protein